MPGVLEALSSEKLSILFKAHYLSITFFRSTCNDKDVFHNKITTNNQCLTTECLLRCNTAKKYVKTYIFVNCMVDKILICKSCFPYTIMCVLIVDILLFIKHFFRFFVFFPLLNSTKVLKMQISANILPRS